MSSYFRIRLLSVPASLEDVITGHCFDCGALGVTEALKFSQPDLTYDPEILKVKTHDMDVFFSERPGCEFFDRLLEWDKKLQWEITEEEQKDWLAEWKKGFAPFQLTGPYWIVPSWIEKPAEAKVPIFIDPGMAFGTGTHATTKMASYFVHKLTEKISDPGAKSLLDVGTGTAVLAILADKAGVGKVVGIEIDPEARRVARENILRNNTRHLTILDTPLEELHEAFDFVVANIIDGVLIQLKSSLLSVLKPGGEIFLTGILKEREDIFLEEFFPHSELQILRRIESDEWVGFWCRKETELEAE